MSEKRIIVFTKENGKTVSFSSMSEDKKIVYNTFHLIGEDSENVIFLNRDTGEKILLSKDGKTGIKL